jgi:hypothetical protein
MIDGTVKPIGQVGARLSRAQDVVGYVAVPGYSPATVGRAVFLYIAAYVENSLFCRDEVAVLRGGSRQVDGYVVVRDPFIAPLRARRVGIPGATQP